MRSKQVIGIVLAFGVAFALLAGSGIGPALFGETPGDAETTRTLEEIGDEASLDQEREGGGLVGDVGGDNEPTITGIVISGGQFVAQLMVAVALLPVTLMNLGFPRYFAVPVGFVAQVIAFIGLAQFVTGRELL